MKICDRTNVPPRNAMECGKFCILSSLLHSAAPPMSQPSPLVKECRMPQRRLQWSSVAWVLLGMALLLMFGCSGGGSQAQETPAGDAAPATGTSPQEPPSTDPGTTPAPQNPTTPPGSMEPPAPTPPLLSDTPVAAP